MQGGYGVTTAIRARRISKEQRTATRSVSDGLKTAALDMEFECRGAARLDEVAFGLPMQSISRLCLESACELHTPPIFH